MWLQRTYEPHESPSPVSTTALAAEIVKLASQDPRGLEPQASATIVELHYLPTDG